MKIEILADTIANNQVVHAGDVLETNLKDGRFLIALGKAAELREVVDDAEFVTEEIISDEVRVRRRARRP